MQIVKRKAILLFKSRFVSELKCFNFQFLCFHFESMLLFFGYFKVYTNWYVIFIILITNTSVSMRWNLPGIPVTSYILEKCP